MKPKLFLLANRCNAQLSRSAHDVLAIYSTGERLVFHLFLNGRHIDLADTFGRADAGHRCDEAASMPIVVAPDRCSFVNKVTDRYFREASP